MAIIIGSARIGENGKATGGASGDQKQTSKPDYSGEISMQNFYVSSLGWNVLRAKQDSHANAIATAMEKYCNDSNVGYDQNGRLGIMSYTGTGKTEADCSSLVRRCVKDATGTDVGNFTTYNEKSVLLKSGLFDFVGKYTSSMTLYTGDILVTCTKGHTVVVTSGNARGGASVAYYPKYTGTSVSIVMALGTVGEKDTSLTHRKKIAVANGISNYRGTANQNSTMLALLKAGKLVRA